VEYIARLQATIESDLAHLMATATDKQTAKMGSCLSGLSAVSNKLKNVLDSGMAALRMSRADVLGTEWIYDPDFTVVSLSLLELHSESSLKY